MNSLHNIINYIQPKFYIKTYHNMYYKMFVIGIPKEIKVHERRVSLIPEDVKLLVDKGYTVYVETSAGLGASFSDLDYKEAGACICNTAKDVFHHANVIVKVKEPLEPEYELITNKHTIFSFFHFASSPPLLAAMEKSGATCIAYETIQLEDKSYPILAPMSRIAGEQAIIKANEYQHNNTDNVVTIIGAGNVGKAAADKARLLGYKNINLMDKNYERLKALEAEGFTVYEMSEENLHKLLKESNIIIGSIYNTGEKATKLISNEMLDLVPENCIIMDVAIDQGGITDQSRPMTFDDPIITYNKARIYCVPNIPSSVPYEASCLLSKAVFPYLSKFLETS